MAESQSREGVLTESRSEQKLDRPRMWRVLLHNDDYTTQDFVVWVLETVFRKPRGEAFTIMLSVHRSGLGVAGIYTHDVAESKLIAMLDEKHARSVLAACGVQLDTLKKDLMEVLAKAFSPVPAPTSVEPEPTLAFDRVIQQAVVHAAVSSAKHVDSGNLLVFILQEEE